MSINPIFRALDVDPRQLRFRFWKAGTLAFRLYGLYGRIRTNYAWQQAVTKWGRASGWVGSGNFLILSAARSGTTLLVDYLNCHTRIRCRGEILNSDWGCYGNPRGMGTDRLRLQVEAFFVKRPGLLAGAKILTYQLEELHIKLPSVVEILHEPSVIVLYREETLEQFASLKMAERDRVWHSNKPVKNEPMWLDPAMFVAFAERERRMWRENIASLDGLRVHYVSYEQLTRDTDKTMRHVFEFLGLKNCRVDSPLVKLNPQPLSRRLINYQAFLRDDIRPHTVLRLPLSEGLEAAKAA